MSDINPSKAAELADGIYAAQSELLATVFLKKAIFSQKTGGFQQLNAKVGFRIINGTDGFGICARGGVGYEKDLFIMFRGTTLKNYGADLITDARLGVESSKTGLPVHIGFNHAFTSMIPAINEFLANHPDAIGTVHIIGHSLGGAVAALAAEWLSSRRNNIKLYTFGAPKSGLEFFAKKLTQKVGADNIYRVYHSSDVVPMVPVYPFTHSPTTHCGYQIARGSLVSLPAHKMVNYIKSVENSSWPILKHMGEQVTDSRTIEYWLKSDKPLNPADPRTWDWINAGLTWVLRKVVGGAMALLQSPFMSAFSLADKIALILKKGIDLSAEASGWVLSLMRKIMQALGQKVAKVATELTQQLMRLVLKRLIEKMSAEAVRAVRGLINKF